MLVALALSDLGHGERSERVPDFWILLVLVAGCFVCGALSDWAKAKGTARKALALVPLGVFVALTAGYGLPRMTPVQGHQIAAYVESFDEPLERTVKWRRFGVLAAHARQQGTA